MAQVNAPTAPLRRSLITKIYVFAVAAFVVGSATSFWVTHHVVEEHDHEHFDRMMIDQAAYVGRQVEAHLGEGVPPTATIADLQESLHLQLTWVPWQETSQYPPAVRDNKVLAIPNRPGMGPPSPWIRIEDNGKPVGALHVGFRGPPHHGGPPWPLIFNALVIPALLMLPPLLFWVVRPLRRMAAVADRLGHGDLATPVTVDRQDEFGDLQRAFEGMRARLHTMIAQRERLLVDISHELRGPLSRVTLALPLLEQGGADPTITGIVQNELHTMDDLLGELLSLARQRAGASRPHMPVNLADVADKLITARQLVLSDNKLSIRTALQPSWVVADERLLMRAIGNVLDNAIKYTPAGGLIAIETETVDGMAQCRVIDNGPGIATADMAHVFEAFYRPDDSRSRETGGTGLGLAIVRSITDAYQGKAGIDSSVGQGTTVTLQFPIAPPNVLPDQA